jgi:hypothetical protein
VSAKPSQEQSSTLSIPVPKSRSERYIDKVFANADSNHDGSINFDEVYELVLKIYIQLNRQAPIPAPTRETVMQVYQKSDKNRDNSLNRDEFQTLVKTVSQSAFYRVASFQLVKMVGAPLLTEYLIRTLSGKQWLLDLAGAIIPDRFHEKVMPVITSTAFCRAALLVLLLMFLGHIVLDIVDMFLAMMLLAVGKEEKPEVESRCCTQCGMDLDYAFNNKEWSSNVDLLAEYGYRRGSYTFGIRDTPVNELFDNQDDDPNQASDPNLQL